MLMPIWIIILQLIISSPKIWNAIKDIWEFIQGMRKSPEKKIATEKFRAIAKQCLKDKCIPLSTEGAISSLRKELGMVQ